MRFGAKFLKYFIKTARWLLHRVNGSMVKNDHNIVARKDKDFSEIPVNHWGYPPLTYLLVLSKEVGQETLF